MTTPVPEQPGLAEYKHTKRKKTLYSPWRDIPWSEQKALGKEFKAAGEGRWPVDKILEERINRKENNRLEYRVLWKRHPVTGELWAPEWVHEDIDKRAVEEWEEEQTKKRKRGRPSNGNSVKRIKRARAVRTLSDSSSDTKEGQEDEEGVTLHTSTAGEEGQTQGPPPSSVEIAETQQDPSHLTDISVHVLRTALNLDDYESLHSSQLKGSDRASKEVSSPIRSSGKSANDLSQAGAVRVPPKRRTNGAISISSSSQQPTSSDSNVRPEPSRLRSRPSKNKNTSLAYPQPLTRDLQSSPLSTGPEFVPSTQHNSNDHSLDKASAPEASPRQNDDPPSSWNFQIQLPSRLLTNDPIPLPSKTIDDRQRSRASPTRSRSDRSYHSAEQTPGEASWLFCSPGPAGPKTDSSNSSFGEDFVLDSIESDTQPVRNAMNVDLITSPPEPGLAPVVAPQATIYDAALGGSALPIQNSIEEEEPGIVEPPSSDSKGSSSQQSIENERDLPQIAGLVQPSLPILGPNEYVLALPCEGKVQSTYADIIKAKEKHIKKFLSRHESIGSGNGSPNRTHERNEMSDMIQRLHDTVTHMDLGLPASTQYSINSQEDAAYANYAGTKFMFLGLLVEFLHLVGVSIVIMAQEGQIQDLIEQYLRMKPNVVVKRQDRMARSKSPASDRVSRDFQVELVSTWSTHQVDVRSKPALMIAFDASFDAQDPQVARIRARFDRGTRLMPVLHLLTTNSSEHVDRCIPKSLPSPLRLKALVRYTCSALPNLGGKLTYLERESDLPIDRPMDFSDLQRGLRKSPERKLISVVDNIKNAVLSPHFGNVYKPPVIPTLELTEFDETPSMKPSRTTTRPETPREADRSRTPVSRAGTPSGRKRLLDIDGVLPALTKRQRLTPLRDSLDASTATSEPSQLLLQLQEQVKKLQTDLLAEREARQAAEQARDHAKEQLTEWQRDHAGLQRRYEKRMTKCHELDREKTRLLKAIENNKARHERTIEDNMSLRQKNIELQKQLTTIREEIKAGGGDAATLETAREEARTLLVKTTILEKSLENTRKDFEFTRSQYQNASTRATELAGQVTELEAENEILTKQASDEKRRLRMKNHELATAQHIAKIDQLERERKSKDALLRRVEEENRQLKRNRGVQTRGSSVQPPGSPGMDGGHRTRSRHSSPAPGLVPPAHRVAVVGGSSLRNEQ
ncbi:hypothetical protein H2200_010837 [Cladophialophora chaetospira]|uniref:Chromo domain-containing protein n=1 Tax=Cladophialophora chaetospira TaxID=386627 RepID=A0AA38X0X9_9EURO|nr:hypothetical protein H2200_010837 [Cladophialophora chaetospira]